MSVAIMDSPIHKQQPAPEVVRTPLAAKDLNTSHESMKVIASSHSTKRKLSLLPSHERSPFNTTSSITKTKMTPFQYKLQSITPNSLNRTTSLSTQSPPLYNGDTPRVSKVTKTVITEKTATINVTTSMHSTRKEALLAAQTEHWKRKYRKAFPQFVFYFDQVDHTSRNQITKQVKQLGASVELFFSAKVTHVITTREIPTEKIEQTSLDTPAKPAKLLEVKEMDTPAFILSKAFERAGPSLQDLRAAAEGHVKTDILTTALQRGMKVWTLNKLVKQVLRRLIDHPKTSSKPQDLSNLLQDEKVFGTKDRDPKAKRQDRYYFKAPFILVEDATKIHRPIMVKEYHNNYTSLLHETPWPQIYWHNPPGRSLFLYYGPPPIQEGDQESRGEGNMKKDSITQQASKPTQIRMPSSRLILARVDSNASGIANSITSTITSTKSNMLGPNNASSLLQNPTIERLGRRELVSRREGPTNRRGFASPSKDRGIVKDNTEISRKRRVRPLYVRAMETNKPGYCENCRAKYDNFERHAKSKEHRRFAQNDENWSELDDILAQLDRSEWLKPSKS